MIERVSINCSKSKNGFPSPDGNGTPEYRSIFFLHIHEINTYIGSFFQEGKNWYKKAEHKLFTPKYESVAVDSYEMDFSVHRRKDGKINYIWL